MPEAAVEEIELEDDGCQTVETEQERLDRDGIYGEIKRELIKRGIPAHEIAFIHDFKHDFKTPAEKARAFAAANAGKIMYSDNKVSNFSCHFPNIEMSKAEFFCNSA